jgi:hypothetical protein
MHGADRTVNRRACRIETTHRPLTDNAFSTRGFGARRVGRLTATMDLLSSPIRDSLASLPFGRALASECVQETLRNLFETRGDTK